MKTSQATCTFLQSIGALLPLIEFYQKGLSDTSPFTNLIECGCKMSYNPRITPLTINVGPAASYQEPGQQPSFQHHPHQPLQVPQVPHVTQVRQVQPAYCQQFVHQRRNNCNKSCLVAIVLIVCKLSQLFTIQKGCQGIYCAFIVF